MVNEICFQRSVGGEEESVFGGNQRDGAGLLISLQHNIDLAEIARGAQNAAFVAVIAGQDPETISPWVVDDVVHVTDRAWESVRDIPGETAVGGGVDVDFVARALSKYSPQ